ncbi:MAG TPA: DoxX family protein [Xanthobacteraceae bacterium]|nr:DoxX family protein [Xanthobacteraceae bacterium]
MPTIKTWLLPFARVLMSSLFIWDGVLQLRNPGGTAQYYASVHVPLPDVAIWISTAILILGGLALLVGFKTRWAAAVLALFCLGTAFGVHLPAGDQANMINFYKNLAIAGGFFYVISFGAGGMSVDQDNAAAG